MGPEERSISTPGAPSPNQRIVVLLDPLGLTELALEHGMDTFVCGPCRKLRLRT
jgi:hypothetical protein